MFLKIHDELLKEYGPQGWWPLISLESKIGKNPTKTGSLNGYVGIFEDRTEGAENPEQTKNERQVNYSFLYHPGDFSYPKNSSQKFEIILGALLTQNTSWVAVEKALLNLKKLGALSPKKLLELDDEKLKAAIKPAGYFNQKSKRAKILAKWFLELKQTPTRNELLALHGVGEETADSILLYAFSQPSFVVDNYTRRIFTRLGLIQGKEKYGEIKNLIEQNLKSDFKLFQEYHALLVEHAKNFYLKKENSEKDFLLKLISGKFSP